MPIDPFIEHGAFEPEATAAMGEAFEAACKELHDAGNAEAVRKLIAEQIIAAASRGELDPVRLRMAALAQLYRVGLGWIIRYPKAAGSVALRDYNPHVAKAASAPAESSLLL